MSGSAAECSQYNVGVTITPDSVQAPINTQWAFTGTDEGLGGNKASVPASAATDCNSNQIVFGVPQSRGGQNPVSSPAKGEPAFIKVKNLMYSAFIVLEFQLF